MRIRSIKPEFWKDERLLALPRDARLLYIALWNEADDEGRLRGRRDYLRGQLFPCDPGPWFDKSLDLLISAKRVLTYDSDGLHFAWIPTFREHQHVNHPTASKLPPPPAGDVHTVTLTEESGSPPVSLPPSRARAAQGSGTQGSGTQGSGGQAPPPDKPAAPPTADPGDQEAEDRATETKAAADYLDELCAVARGHYASVYGFPSAVAAGPLRKLVRRLSGVAKGDGFTSRKANAAEVGRLVLAYLRDGDTRLAEAKHPLLWLGTNVDKYRRPRVVQAAAEVKP